MVATDILVREHRVIEQGLTVLEELARRAERGEALDESDALGLLEFFREYADRVHHAKEEDLLFPLMEARGFPQEGGPTGVMLLEHDDGRRHVSEMRVAVPLAARGVTDAVRAFARHARSYAGMLREHISKEDHCLYSMANNAFSAADQEELAARFEQVEEGFRQAGVQERFVTRVQALAERYGAVGRPAPAAVGAASHGCGHH